MDIDATFLPVAVELIQNVFPTPITYVRNTDAAYDPATGDMTATNEAFQISAGVLSRSRTEAGGTGEDYTLELWIDHSDSGFPHLPTTRDVVTYDGTAWKVVNVLPTYSSKGLIASKLMLRNN
nr:hypothetical protein [uncultured Mediterranean phage uvMED]